MLDQLFIYKMKSFTFKTTCCVVLLLLTLAGRNCGQTIDSDGREHLGSSPAVLGSSSSPTVVAERGKLTRLKCIYSAEPEPKVHWLKEGKEVRHSCDTCISKVKNEPGSSFLDITPFEKNDFGEYECRLRNQHGTAKLKIFLKKSDIVQTKCQIERATSDDPRKKHEFRPVCNDDGSYHEVQCSIEHSTCWCVNKHGKKTLDVVTGVNGLHCFAPKDLSVVAIFVLIQGIVMALFMVDQLSDMYTGYSISRTVKKRYNYYRKRTGSRKEGYKLLKKKVRKRNKMRPLPSLPVEKRLKSS